MAVNFRREDDEPLEGAWNSDLEQWQIVALRFPSDAIKKH